MSADDEIRVDETSSTEATRAVTVLAVLLGVLVLALVVAVGAPVIALSGGGGVAVLVLSVLALVAGLSATAVVIRRQRHHGEGQGHTILASDGITRRASGETMFISWQDVAAVSVVDGDLASGERLVLLTRPPLALVPVDGPSRELARLAQHRFGGAVALPMSVLVVTPEELAARIERWSHGSCALGRGRPAG